MALSRGNFSGGLQFFNIKLAVQHSLFTAKENVFATPRETRPGSLPSLLGGGGD